MKHLKQIMAFILTLVLAVYGLPVSPAAQANGTDIPADYPSGRMRFVQKVERDENGEIKKDKKGNLLDGFDESTGILKMSLQVKPVIDGSKWFVSGGAFMFQTDASTVIPLSNPSDGSAGQQLLGYNGRVMVVSASEHPELEAYADPEKVERIKAPMTTAMSAPTETPFDSAYTAYIVARAPVSEDDSASLLDCVFQFKYPDSTTIAADRVDEDGYVTVMDFEFQCYDGHHNPATSSDYLFSRSIRVPETVEAAQAIRSRFTYTKEGSSDPVALTMTSGAFLQRCKRSGEWHDKVFYYYDQPELSQWRSLVLSGDSYVRLPRDTWWVNGGELEEQAGETVGLWYDGCKNKYRVNGFHASCANTFNSTDEPMAGADFNLPPNDEFRDPRYVIPTLHASEEEEGDGEAQETAAELRIPDAYRGEKNKPMPMKYFFSVDVAAGSTESPMTNGRLNQFLDGLQWEFWLDGIYRLNQCKTKNEETAGTDITVPNEGVWTVKAAEIDDENVEEKYQGTKVWKVYDKATGRYLMTCPVGVLMGMDPNTDITYADGINDVEAAAKGKAPQFYVTSAAADGESYIWHYAGSALIYSGKFDIRASYDPEGADYQGSIISVRLYRETSVPTAADLQTEAIKKVKLSPEDETASVDGFYVGTQKLNDAAVETVDDAVSSGISIRSVLYDQYGIPVSGKWNQVEFVPGESTAAAMRAAGKDPDKDNPFTVEQVKKPVAGGAPGAVEITNEYTIKYKPDMDVNDVMGGEYILRAFYTEPKLGRTVEETKSFYVVRPDSRLDYFSTRFTVNSGTAQTESEEISADGTGKIITVSCGVPSLGENVTLATTTGTIEILELATQWRRANVPDPSVYDIISDVRTNDKAAIDLEKLGDKAPDCIQFEVIGEVPGGVSVPELDQGRITYNNKTEAGAELVCRVTATYDGVQRYVEYHFQFYRVDSFLQGIIIRPENNATAIYVEVPTSGKFSKNLDGLVLPMDQYNTQWNWGGVETAYAPGGRLNKEGVHYDPWTIFTEEELPAGVTLSGTHNETLTIDHTAVNSRFQIKAKFAAKTSTNIGVVVRRQTSQATTAVGPLYNGGAKVISPSSLDEKDLELPLELTVNDQYGAEMTRGDTPGTYSGVWSCTVEPASAKSFISIDKDSGALTVKKFAPNCKVSVTGLIRNSKLTSLSTTVTVERDNARIVSMTVEPGELKYPSRESSTDSSVTNLKAYAITQYSQTEDDRQLLDVVNDRLGWTLKRVEFREGGGVYVYRETESETLPAGAGEISYESGKYTANSSVTLTDGGILTFNNVTDAAQIPEYITVIVKNGYGGKAEQRIHVDKEDSVPYLIYFPIETYQNGIQVPTAGETATLELTALVQDQYGVFMKDREVTWSLSGQLPSGVTVDTAAKKVVVDNTAKAGDSVKLIAHADGLADEEQFVTIVQNEPLKIGKLEITGIRGKDGLEIDLPASKTGPGYDVYTLLPVVRDQFDNPISSAVTWSLVNADGVTAEFTDTASGILRVNYTDAALASGTASITVRATTKSSNTVTGAPISQDATIQVTPAEGYPVYAVPTLEYDPAQEYDPGTDTGIFMTDENGNHQPIVPKKDALKNTEVTLKATVMDQYGRPMNDQPAKMEIVPSIDLSLTTKSTIGEGSATSNLAALTIGSRVTGYLVTVTAVPTAEGAPSALQEDSYLRIQLSKGTSYPAALELDEENDYAFEIPTWVSDPSANEMKDPTSSEMTLKAFVVDQYDSWMSGATWLYPVWEFVGDHEGVEFSPEMAKDAEGNIHGDLKLDVTNKAVGQGKLEQDVTLRVWAYGIDQTDAEYEANFVKEVTLHFTRKPVPEEDPVEYLYIPGVDANGVAIEALQRPYAKADGSEGEAVYHVKPTLYDLYGAEVEKKEENSKIVMQLHAGDIRSRGFLVEEKYERGQSAETGATPIFYEIYRTESEAASFATENEAADGAGGQARAEAAAETEEAQYNKILIATFDCKTGDFTINTQCQNLEYVNIRAVYEPLGQVDGIKWIRIPIMQETVRPVRATIASCQGKYYMDSNARPTLDENGNPIETPAVTDRVYPVVFDQYGQRYTGKDVSVLNWELLMPDKDETGEYPDYIELNAEGMEKLSGEYLLSIGSAGSVTSNTVVVKPDNFDQNRSAILRCSMYDRTNNEMLVGEQQIQVLRKSNNSAFITVTFDAGEYGKLVGAAEHSIAFGEAVTNPPGVKTVPGYGFLGWTTDGETVVDASKVAVFGSVSYVAVYRDVSKGKFLSGYTDKTVRPDRPITRAEFVFMVALAVGGYDEAKDYGKPFSDVPRGKWYSNVIAFAAEKGIVSGYGDGTFRPAAMITRAEAARILADAGGLTAKNKGTFPDVESGAWYEKYVEALYEAGVVAGYVDGTYRPHNKITRAEAVKMIVRITKFAPSELERANIRNYAYCPFTDLNREHWAYSYILRAAGLA